MYTYDPKFEAAVNEIAPKKPLALFLNQDFRDFNYRLSHGLGEVTVRADESGKFEQLFVKREGVTYRLTTTARERGDDAFANDMDDTRTLSNAECEAILMACGW